MSTGERISIVTGLLIVAAVIMLGFYLVQPARAGDQPGVRGFGVETFYDESTSVFCATRAKAISCVYVPRDTVRQ